MNKAILTLGLLFSIFGFGSTDSKPIMAIELFRHGARAAYAPTFDTSGAWTGYYGELTKTGMRQHYLLGQAVAKDYPDLLGSYNPAQLFVYSTDVNRTIMSAYSHLFGMFTPGNSTLNDYQNKTALPPGLENYNFSGFISDNYALPNALQPAPVHVIPRVRDYALTPSDGCKNFSNISFSALNDPAFNEFQTLMNSTTQLIVNYSKQYNITLTDIWSYQSLADILIANYFENITAPVNITYGSKEWNDLMFYNDWVVTYLYSGQLQIRQITSVYLFERIFAQLRGKLNGTFNKTFAIHSAHDVTLIPMLSTLGIMNVSCLTDVYLGKASENDCQYPDYSANIITELYNDTDKPYVKIRYNGKYRNVCNTTNNTCDLDALQQLVNQSLQGYTTSNFLQDCGINSQVDPNPPKPNPDPNNSQKSTLIIIIIAIGIVCLVELAVLISMLLRGRKKEDLTTQHGDHALVSRP